MHCLIKWEFYAQPQLVHSEMTQAYSCIYP